MKQKFRQTQIKAAVQVNQELLKFYWDLGADIVEKQETTNWGSKFLNRVSSDLTEAFPEVKGFSISNIKYIRQWYLFYNQQSIIGQQAVCQLGKETVVSQLDTTFGQQLVAQIPERSIE